MRRFYENVCTDAEALRFSAVCEICEKKLYGARVPFLCRNVRTLARCENGKANKLSQALYNRAKANSTQLIAMKLNQCLRCRSWVCDACFDNDDAVGVCNDCSKKDGR